MAIDLNRGYEELLKAYKEGVKTLSLVVYGDCGDNIYPENVAIEDEASGTVLIDFDRPESMEAPTAPENPQQKLTEIVNWLSANADNLSTAFGCPRADIYDITDALTNLEPEADEDEATVIEPGYI